MLIKRFVLSLMLLNLSGLLLAQTDVSLFWRKDSLQQTEIFSAEGDLYRLVGHHGPAIENKFMALRLYFNHSGSIDVYSKKIHRLELAQALWYPSEKMQQEQGFGCDEYKVGSTVGLGGINLWDGRQVVKLTATRGRTARVSKNEKGASMEMLAKGIAYKDKMVDILIRVSVNNTDRQATVEAVCTSGHKVQFLTGVNRHPGNSVFNRDGRIGVWGRHPADVSKAPVLIGGGMKYRPSDFAIKRVTDDAIQLISKPAKKLKTIIVSAGEREEELNTEQAFFDYVKSF
ncbi:MAG TPA: DUF4861 family protein [Bacteroidales bacterium]|nr:DUF4861 family protein [Bacteroidales bacterium]HPL06839.1 DUF4861 family protein [Bacteroidales bacterium]HQM93624.1 DUF4861 family protein [Bacteroidales bacterium]